MATFIEIFCDRVKHDEPDKAVRDDYETAQKRMLTYVTDIADRLLTYDIGPYDVERARSDAEYFRDLYAKSLGSVAGLELFKLMTNETETPDDTMYRELQRAVAQEMVLDILRQWPNQSQLLVQRLYALGAAGWRPKS